MKENSVNTEDLDNQVKEKIQWIALMKNKTLNYGVICTKNKL